MTCAFRTTALLRHIGCATDSGRNNGLIPCYRPVSHRTTRGLFYRNRSRRENSATAGQKLCIDAVSLNIRAARAVIHKERAAIGRHARWRNIKICGRCTANTANKRDEQDTKIFHSKAMTRHG